MATTQIRMRGIYNLRPLKASNPSIHLSGLSIAEDASVDDVIGLLSVSNSPEGVTWTFAITSDPDSKFKVANDDELQVDDAFDYETKTSHQVTIEADNGVDDPIERTFTITVTNVLEVTLATLSLDTDEITSGAVEDTVVGALQGVSSGSTLSLTNNAGGRFKLDGTNIVAGATATDHGTATSHNITVRETHSDGINSPKDSVIEITVEEAEVGSLAAHDLDGDTGFAANFLDDFFLVSDSERGSAFVSSPSFDGPPIDLFTYSNPSDKYLQNASGVLYQVTGGALPFEWQGGVIKGLRVEPERTNLITQARDLTTGWTNANTTGARNQTGIDGGANLATTLTDTATSGTHNVFLPTTAASGATIALSAFIKKGTHNYAFLNFASGTQHHISKVFDINSGVVGESKVGSSSGTIVASGIEAWGNGWYRCWIVGSVNQTNPYVGIGFANAASGNSYDAFGSPQYSGSGTTLIFDGVQAEIGSYPSSLIPTAGSTVTRNADVIGPPLADFPWNSGSGTYLVDAISGTPADNGTILTLAPRSTVRHIEAVKWTVP